jgi:hypothetical protein
MNLRPIPITVERYESRKPLRALLRALAIVAACSFAAGYLITRFST